MASKILVNRFGEPYQTNQNINAKLDVLIEMFGELKTDVEGLKKDVNELKTDVKGLKKDVNELKTDVALLQKDTERFDKKIDKVEENNKIAISEVKAEISSARWQVIAVIVAVVAMVAAIISALK